MPLIHIVVTHKFELPPSVATQHDLKKLKEMIMAVRPEIADLQAAVKDAAARSATTAQSFKDQIAALKQQIADGNLSQEDRDALADALNTAKGIDPADPTTVTPPAPPEPTPTP